jgi:hypothetical protein
VPQDDGGQHGEHHRDGGQRRPEPVPGQLRDPLIQHFIDNLGHPVIEHVAEPVQELISGRGGRDWHTFYHKSAKRGLQANFCRKTSAAMLGWPHGDDAAPDHW